MKQILVLLLFTFAVAHGWDAGFRVRFGLTGIGKDHFVPLPQILSDAKSQNWVQEQRPDKVLPSLSLYCHPGFIICVLYDDNEYVAGIQIALPIDKFQDAVWDWDIQGYLKWTPSNGQSYWTQHQYYVNEEYLAISAAERKANHDPKTLLQVGGSVWVSGNRGELFELTRRPDSLLARGFTQQGCVPSMGHHYWRLNRQSACDSESFPWFTLNDQRRDLIGVGLSVPGKLPELDRDWFERPPPIAVKLVVPFGPKCVQQLARNPGFVTIHVYFVDKPWTNLCLF